MHRAPRGQHGNSRLATEEQSESLGKRHLADVEAVTPATTVAATHRLSAVTDFVVSGETTKAAVGVSERPWSFRAG
jgi:hypothetical protein